MRKFFKALFIVSILLGSSASFADLRSINIVAFDDARTSDTWPHLSYDAFAQFCQPRTRAEYDMMRKGSFANTTVNDGEILERLMTSDWKSKIQFKDFYAGSIYAEVEMSQLAELRSLLGDIAEIYDLTGITVTLPGILDPQ
jgi:hypothetical protein